MPDLRKSTRIPSLIPAGHAEEERRVAWETRDHTRGRSRRQPGNLSEGQHLP